jgi:isopropylmalate/homocitrate/citramalate synthase
MYNTINELKWLYIKFMKNPNTMWIYNVYINTSSQPMNVKFQCTKINHKNGINDSINYSKSKILY